MGWRARQGAGFSAETACAVIVIGIRPPLSAFEVANFNARACAETSVTLKTGPLVTHCSKTAIALTFGSTMDRAKPRPIVRRRVCLSDRNYYGGTAPRAWSAERGSLPESSVRAHCGCVCGINRIISGKSRKHRCANHAKPWPIPALSCYIRPNILNGNVTM